MGRPRRSAYKGVCGVVTAAGLLASCSVLPGDVPDAGGAGSFIRDVVAGKGRSAGDDGKRAPAAVAPPVPFGLYVGAGEEGVRRMPRLQQWLGGTEPTVGHTYLPGDRWADIEGEPGFLEPWTRWRRERDERMFVLNVPMLDRSEGELPDDEVRRLLRAGASGRFDDHFRTLAERLVRLKAPDTVIVLGWEMNGSTYTHRCGPDPGAWKAYWRRIVDAMRSVRGQDFRFDFAPARGADSVPWTECYPGDEHVDIIGMDSYDQPADQSFEAQVNEAHGLRAQVDFAREHGKRISYPEWGLAENGDNAEYVRRMLDWFDRHRPVYHTLTDYCPHGVWQCPANPDSAETFRTALFRRDTGEGGNGSAAGEWGEGSPGAPGEPGVPGEPGDQASPDGPGGPGGEASPEASKGLPGGGVPGR